MPPDLLGGLAGESGRREALSRAAIDEHGCEEPGERRQRKDKRQGEEQARRRRGHVFMAGPRRCRDRGEAIAGTYTKRSGETRAKRAA